MISRFTFSYSCFVRHEDTDEQRNRAEDSAFNRFIEVTRSYIGSITTDTIEVGESGVTPEMIEIDLIEADAFDAGVRAYRTDHKKENR